MKKTLAVLMIIILAAAGAYYFSKKTIVDTLSRPAVEEEKKAWQEKTKQLEDKLAALQEELKKTEPAVPPEKLSEAFGESDVLTAQEKKTAVCN